MEEQLHNQEQQESDEKLTERNSSKSEFIRTAIIAITVLGICALIFFVSYNHTVKMEADIKNTINKIKTFSDIKPYIKGNITYTNDDSDQYTEYLTVVFNVNDRFSKLTHNQKVDLLNQWENLLVFDLDFKNFNCANRSCDVKNVIIKDGSDVYKIDLDWNSITLNGQPFERIKSKEEVLTEEINSAIADIVYQLYYIGAYGYHYSYTFKVRRHPEETYSIGNAEEAGERLVDAMKQINNPTLLEASLRIRENIYQMEGLLEPKNLETIDMLYQLESKIAHDIELIAEYYPNSINHPYHSYTYERPISDLLESLKHGY